MSTKSGKGHWTRNALLSLSIDLCNSTSIKQEIVARSEEESQYRSRLYASYVLHFFNTERQFYYRVRQQDDLDIRRLLLIKMIGDEYWFVYEVNTEEKDVLKRTASAFFNAIDSMVKNAPPFDIPEEISGAKSEKPAVAKRMEAPLKAYMDLIGEPAEVNMARFEFLKGHLPRLLGASGQQYRIDDDFIELCKKLNLANLTIADGMMTKQIRPDFIGLEVDRFFRLTKFCRPKKLTVGNSLIKLLDYTDEETAEKEEDSSVKKFVHKVPQKDGKTFSYDERKMISEDVSASDMKGLSKGYTVHHLF